MQETPLISVVIPAYNAGLYIGKCLKSVLEQPVASIEILIYDDGSVDDTRGVVRQINDRRVKMFCGEVNKGVVYARNFLLEKARGKYIAFQDADDWSHHDRFRLQLDYLESRPDLGGCGCQFVKVVNDRIVFSSNLPCDALTISTSIPEKFYFLPGSLFVRKSAVDRLGYYNPFFGNDGNEDTYFASKLALSYGVENVNAHLYFYNLNLDSLTKFGYSSIRRIYLADINALLLKDLRKNGTNFLEGEDFKKLVELENNYGKRYASLGKFDLFERVIGQLLFYGQYKLAMREVVKYMLRTQEVFASARLFAYVIRKSLRYAG